MIVHFEYTEQSDISLRMVTGKLPVCLIFKRREHIGSFTLYQGMHSGFGLHNNNRLNPQGNVSKRNRLRPAKS